MTENMVKSVLISGFGNIRDTFVAKMAYVPTYVGQVSPLRVSNVSLRTRLNR
jgi:hypothetical protein